MFHKKNCNENHNTHFVYMNLFFSKIVPFIRYVEKYWIAGQATEENILRSMRFACWISKATNTHSECAILIAFPRQQWLRERA